MSLEQTWPFELDGQMVSVVVDGFVMSPEWAGLGRLWCRPALKRGRAKSNLLNSDRVRIKDLSIKRLFL